MSTASARMTNRCQIERDPKIGTNDEGETNYAPLGSPVMCFLWAQAGREAVDPEKVVVTEDLRALFPLNTDITLLDRINGVTDRLGNILDERILLIEAVLRRTDHLEAVLEVVQS